ncbi:hypothetical protein ILYODFUR_025030 [Ilyodon furcidens]|uniref:Uncharacterized protein n=1 Tax=Ilyodon furcidens TaxID=33524 RepID=A0ABV0UIX0_9TELE
MESGSPLQDLVQKSLSSSASHAGLPSLNWLSHRSDHPPEGGKSIGKGNKSSQLSDFCAITLLQMYYPTAGISFQTAFNTPHPTPSTLCYQTLAVNLCWAPLLSGIKMSPPNHTAFVRQDFVLFLQISVVGPG